MVSQWVTTFPSHNFIFSYVTLNLGLCEFTSFCSYLSTADGLVNCEMGLKFCGYGSLLSTYWLAFILTDESARVYCYMAYLINSPLLTWVLLHGLLGLKYLMLLVLTLPKWLCIS